MQDLHSRYSILLLNLTIGRGIRVSWPLSHG